MQMSRYWEAYNLLRAIRTSLSIEVALQFFDFFFIGISEHLSNQAAKLAYLAAMIEMLDFIHECRQHDYAELRILLKEKASDLIEFPQRIIDEAEELLIYFFDDLEHASGLLFERWHRRAIYFVDQERDRLVAESIQEQDEVMGSGLPVPDRRPKLKLPSKYNVLEKLDKDKTATYKIYDTP